MRLASSIIATNAALAISFYEIINLASGRRRATPACSDSDGDFGQKFERLKLGRRARDSPLAHFLYSYKTYSMPTRIGEKLRERVGASATGPQRKWGRAFASSPRR